VADIQDQFDVANQISDAIASFSNEAEDVSNFTFEFCLLKCLYSQG